jgi:hypothetical protein
MDVLSAIGFYNLYKNSDENLQLTKRLFKAFIYTSASENVR